jgi:hypothetical protein
MIKTTVSGGAARRLAASVLGSSIVSVLVGLGCGGGQKVTPPPPPFRPEEVMVVGPSAPTKVDCDPTDPRLTPDAWPYVQRAPAIEESKALAASGLAKLQSAEGPSLDPKTREELITDAVDEFLAALGADPYNVNATYNLGAAYARIGRKQCSLNLLERLVLMKDHSSRRVEVNQKFDRLLGRNGAQLDPDFRDMRQDERFRCVVSNIGSNVYTECFKRP